MRVLHITTGLENGGAEAVLARLCEADISAQHFVISLTGPGRYGAQLEQRGIPVWCIGMSRGRVSVRGLKDLFDIVRKVAPDVVQTWMYHASLVGGLIGRLAKVQRVYWGIHHSDLRRQSTKRRTLFIVRLLALLSPWIPARTVYVAQRAREVHEKAGFHRKKGVIIQNGYDTTSFAPDREAGAILRKELRLHDSTPLVGMVARWHPDKDHRLFLSAISSIANEGIRFRCLLVGPGMTWSNEELSDILLELGLEDTCLLLSSRGDIPGVMNALDVHILSSASEAFPNVLAEAMACGTPCITTDVGDAKLIVGETGWIVPTKNARALESAIRTALDSLGTSAFSERKTAARMRVLERFSLETMVSAYHGLWSNNV